jgi:hypothetical protein
VLKLTSKNSGTSSVFLRDNSRCDPFCDWDKPFTLKDRNLIKDLEYAPNKDQYLNNLAKGIPQFGKMADWVDINEHLDPASGKYFKLTFS